MRIDDIIKIAKKVIDPIRRKVILTIGHGIIEAIKDDGDLQFIQATFLEGETKSNVRKMHHFGFSSSAPKGSECIGVSVAGNREAMVVVATENREFRFKNLGEGEVAIYSKSGDYIHLKDGNIIDVKTTTLNIDATDVNITGNLSVGGDSDITGNETVGGDSTVTGDVSCLNAVASASVAAPAIAASGSLVVAGQQLNDYQNHTHSYDDDNGTSVTTKSTSGVS